MNLDFSMKKLTRDGVTPPERPHKRRASQMSGLCREKKQPCLSAGLSLQAATECRSLQFNCWLGPFDGFPPNLQMQRGRYKPG